jgi:hypothetical protein
MKIDVVAGTRATRLCFHDRNFIHCATTALAQSGCAALSNEVHVFQMPSNEHRATPQALAREQSLLESSDFASVQGEQPLCT